MQQMINGLSYHYTQHGSGGLLVLLHGFTGSVANWQPLQAQLAPHYRVLAIDLPGHGGTAAPSEPTRYAMPQVAQDIIALIDQMRVDIAPVNLVGYSMGGRLALYLAVHYAAYLASLTLESASPGLADAVARAQRRVQDEQLADWLEAVGVSAFVDYWQALPLFATQRRLPPITQQRLRQQRLQNSTTGLANSLRGMGTGQQPSLWHHLNALDLPVHVLVGQRDTKFVGIGRAMHQQLPNAHFTIMPDAGHTIHLERPSLYQHAILHFLEGLHGRK